MAGAVWAGAVGLLLVLIWFLGHTFLSSIALDIVRWLDPVIGKVSTTLYFAMRDYTGVYTGRILNVIIPVDYYNWNELEEYRRWLYTVPAEDVTFGQFLTLNGTAVILFRPLLPFLFIYLWVRVGTYTTGHQYRRRLDVHDLIAIAKENNPVIKPAFRQDLLRAHPDEGPFAREASPIRTCIINHLITAREKNILGNFKKETFVPTFSAELNGMQVPGEDGLKYRYIRDNLRKDISKLHGCCEYRPEAANELWLRQLGPLWTGIENLEEHEAALFIIWCAFGLMMDRTAKRFIDQFAGSWMPRESDASGGANIDTTGIWELWEEIRHHEEIIELQQKHAYVSTMLVGALVFGRSKGKLPPAEFLWLKPENRVVWYALHQEGGECTWSEANGIRSHYVAEVNAQGAVYEPYVTSAQEAMLKYIRDEEGWIHMVEDEYETESDAGQSSDQYDLA
ncbi:hypothetical protein A3709_19650 [Halioglobus sp. HI00S01]|nr:hypothetical protein A3709_19650 [Halioglobus sp. HI00S01]